MAEQETPLIDPKIISQKTVSPSAVPAAAASKPDAGGFYWGTGRRKSSIARVRIKPGSGSLLINDRKIDEYFHLDKDRTAVQAPLKAVSGLSTFDVFVNVKGGGTTGQADAVKQGIARALKNYDPTMLTVLREHGYLTRDSRMVERKKAGKPGARRSFQFSKR
jgi:small subunit ribosomal protein S9